MLSASLAAAMFSCLRSVCSVQSANSCTAASALGYGQVQILQLVCTRQRLNALKQLSSGNSAMVLKPVNDLAARGRDR